MYTQYTIFKIKKENHSKLFQICDYGIFSKGLKREFETAVVNEPSVFYCNNNNNNNIFFIYFQTQGTNINILIHHTYLESICRSL